MNIGAFISLRFFVDCTLLEISKIVGMRESAVKKRLYRALEKLRSELKEWGDITIMSIQDRISIVSKSDTIVTNDSMEKVHRDLFNDLPTFHQAVGEVDAPNWFIGTFEGNKLKIVSPLDPGPKHTYETILKSTLHLFTMWLIGDINPLAPKWLCQGIAGYEVKQMPDEFIKNSTSEQIHNLVIPTFQELNSEGWDFETMNGFQFSYLIVEL
ncbi:MULTISPECIES: RNA polymerase sigma factor [Paenibacillus]|uniref:RNA polymerase sigma factor n=1 Tax=Paenibacillus TaxID=44249 RepID=UPI00096ECFD8|nr:sigma factor-like helix-turn-helix DNA-binding protein [Paenibacillus odorifer]OMD53194.1 hypothetical protein BSK55_26975 [Paenibacillus odorifer]